MQLWLCSRKFAGFGLTREGTIVLTGSGGDHQVAAAT